MFDFASSPLPIRSDLVAAFREVWDRLASPGTWWTGKQRVAIAAVARAAYSDGEPLAAATGLPQPAVAAASLIASSPATITAEKIRTWEENGLDSYQYIELIGIVSQITTVDTFHRAMGLDLEPLPEPRAGQPSRLHATPPATLTKAWVPMVGPPMIPVALSAVPAEAAALEALHGPAYLRYEEMQDPAITRGLTRAQMEIVASRTSAINECFY